MNEKKIVFNKKEVDLLRRKIGDRLISIDLPLAIFGDMAYKYVVLNFKDSSLLITFKEVLIKSEYDKESSELVSVEVVEYSDQIKIQTFGNFVFHSIGVDRPLKNIEILNNRLSVNFNDGISESITTPQCIGLCFEDEKMLIDTKGYDSEIFEVRPYVNIIDDSYDIGFDWLGDVDDIKNNRFSYERISYSLLDEDNSFES